MYEITIDNKIISVQPGTTILQAAKSLNIDIPTMCYINGLDSFTSCMVCVVEDMKNGRLLPSCSMLVQNGMIIESHNAKVEQARRDALELLLSEHIGDCQAPCQKGCPASMNIPLMIRQIAAGELDKAIRTVKADIALPAVLGRICPAPCEKVCNRAKIDNPVSICLLKRYSADVDMQGVTAFMPECKPDNGKSVAIIGSGPTGLSAAYYLRQRGYACTIYDKKELPGGMLRYGVDRDMLPIKVLDDELAIFEKMGIKFKLETEIGQDIPFKELLENNDAIVLGTGVIELDKAKRLALDHTDKGFSVNMKTHESSTAGVFIGGSAVRESKMAIRSSAHGKQIAVNIDRYLNGLSFETDSRFESRIGKLATTDLEALLSQADDHEQLKIEKSRGFESSEALHEANRCMHCDCRKPDTCKLRIYSQEYKADQKHYKGESRNDLKFFDQHADVVYEPGKCIKCGICVQITEKFSEKLGLTFIGRGFNVQIQVPFGTELNQALEQSAKECVESCPTAALSFKKDII